MACFCGKRKKPDYVSEQPDHVSELPHNVSELPHNESEHSLQPAVGDGQVLLTDSSDRADEGADNSDTGSDEEGGGMAEDEDDTVAGQAGSDTDVSVVTDETEDKHKAKKMAQKHAGAPRLHAKPLSHPLTKKKSKYREVDPKILKAREKHFVLDGVYCATQGSLPGHYVVPPYDVTRDRYLLLCDRVTKDKPGHQSTSHPKRPQEKAGTRRMHRPGLSVDSQPRYREKPRPPSG